MDIKYTAGGRGNDSVRSFGQKSSKLEIPKNGSEATAAGMMSEAPNYVARASKYGAKGKLWQNEKSDI